MTHELKCETTACDRPATRDVFGPHGQRFYCDLCAEKYRNLMGYMGVPVRDVPIPTPEAG